MTGAEVLYVSYDGMDEPLGKSQVLSYLFRLAGDFDITLVSFEKEGANLSALRGEIEGRGVAWIALRYHRHPPVLSTLYDVLRGGVVVRKYSRPRTLVHVRSYVPALMALLTGRRHRGKLLFDIRGFWADERVEGGIWPAGGWLYRIAKRCERRFFAEADAVVTLTEASRSHIHALTRSSAVPIVVIPTCVDLQKFTGSPAGTEAAHLVWSGSVGTWYRFDLVVPLARVLGLPLTVITRQQDEARDLLADFPARILSLPPAEMPHALHAGDVGLCLVQSSFSKTASAPTRFAEYLASGMPVVTAAGVGDLDAIVEENAVGVVLRSESEQAMAATAASLRTLLRDPGLSARCRDVAVRLFDVETASRRYAELYRWLIRKPRAGRPQDDQSRECPGGAGSSTAPAPRLTGGST